MRYSTDYIYKALKEYRERKGLSQRALTSKTGVPQSHISKIEAGKVDLRLSSLVEMARVLDLELVLVPRHKVPALKSMIQQDSQSGSPIRPAWSLDDEDDD